MPTAYQPLARAARLCIIPEVPHVHLWAREHRMMTSEVTAKAGMYDISQTPYMQEPGESIDDPEVTTTVLQLASRLGKTENCILNPIGRSIHLDPHNILVVYPTKDAAGKFAKEQLMTTFDASHVFDGIVLPTGKGSTMYSKRFLGGRVSMIGANSPSAFRQIQARSVFLDEVDAMNFSEEGDPITLAFKRADNYADATQVVMSTPTIKGLSNIDKWMLKSDYRQYFVQSPFTGNWHVLDWANLVFTDAQKRRTPEAAYYADPDTGDPWTNEQRVDSIHAGEWRPTLPFTGVRGYQANAMISIFPHKKGYKSKYHQWAGEFLEAKDAGVEALKTWTNTFKGETWEDVLGESVDWHPVYERREDYPTDTLPDGVLCITFAADVQEDRIEFEWVGWRDGFESYGLRYSTIVGDTKRGEVWEKLNREILRTWKHPAGGELRMSRGFIDEGHNTEQVRIFCLKMLASGYEVYPSKGLGRAGQSEPELVAFNAQKRQSGVKAPTFNIGVNRAKRTIYSHLNLDPPGAHTMHFTDQPEAGYDEHYFEMLTSERIKTRYYLGQAYKVFEKPSSSTRNEALDIRAYGYAAIVSLNPSWDGLRKIIDKMLPAEKAMHLKPEAEATADRDKWTIDPQKPTVKRPAKAAGKRARGGFINNW